MKTSEIINSICSQLGIAKAELAKRMGIYPSSLYRKLSRESMTFEELQKSLDALGVSMELQFQYPDGRSFSSRENHEQIVDDNELNREILEEVLLDHGLLFEEADNGSKAVAAVKEHEPGYYQFILMDIEMPVMDGYEATVKIRKLPNRIRANIPIIALTANAVAENRERAAVIGMDDFLVKPTNSARLLRSLAKFL